MAHDGTHTHANTCAIGEAMLGSVPTLPQLREASSVAGVVLGAEFAVPLSARMEFKRRLLQRLPAVLCPGAAMFLPIGTSHCRMHCMS